MTISLNGNFIDAITFTGDEPEFIHAYGVFESFRTYSAQPFHLNDYLNRLRASAEAIELPIEASDEDITMWVERHIQRSASTNDVRIKIIAAPSKLYILSTAITIDSTIYTQGITMGIRTLERRMPSTKTLAYFEEHIAHAAAERDGHYDALLINHKQEVLEGAYSNFFFIKHSTLVTARNSILQGVTRNIVLKLADGHYTVEQRKITLEEMLLADECFLTQSTTGVVPVVGIDKRKVRTGAVGKSTQHIMDLFADYTQTYQAHGV